MTTYDAPLPFLPPVRPRGQWAGWGISLAVHAGVLAGLVVLVPPRLPDAPAPGRMRFVLVPPRVPVPVPAPAPVTTVPALVAPATSAPAVRKPAATPPRPRPAPVDTPAAESPPRSASEATPVITATEPVPAADAAVDASKDDADATPTFDMAAARASARLIARHAKDGTVALPERKAPSYGPDDTTQRGMERARRNDCRNAYSAMGLLAVLPLLKDAVTGSGCKW